MKGGEDPEDLRRRTKRFALRFVILYGQLPRTRPAQIMGDQCLRSSTSVGAHYREAHRARSNAEFISKMETALQELDETCYWLELLEEGQIMPADLIRPLWVECDELIRIFVSCVRNAKGR